MEMFGKIRRMHLRDKLSLHEISKRTGLSRNTLRKWLRMPEDATAPTYIRGEGPGKLTEFHDALVLALNADAHRIKQNRRTAKALFIQIKADGYAGGYSRVTDFIRDWRGRESKNPHAYNRKLETFHIGQQVYFDANGTGYENRLRATVDAINPAGLDAFDELIIRANLQLCNDLVQGYVQFEHIQPMLKRIEASLHNIRRVLAINGDPVGEKILTVISLRRCSSEVKKIMSLLIAKHFYNEHKHTVATPPDRTVHLVIDEAHNILSQQSAREHESWRDYRLDL